jgi:hypothetical protein
MLLCHLAAVAGHRLALVVEIWRRSVILMKIYVILV